MPNLAQNFGQPNIAQAPNPMSRQGELHASLYNPAMQNLMACSLVCAHRCASRQPCMPVLSALLMLFLHAGAQGAMSHPHTPLLQQGLWRIS